MTLENLISDIKLYGFDRTKNDINKKLYYKQEIEASIESLQRRKTNFYLENKQMYTNNSKIVNETHVFHNKNEVKI